MNELYYPVLNKDIIQGNEPHHITISVHTSDKVRTGKFEIAKFITDGENSEIVKPEVNAEFKTVLKKYYDMFKGDMDKAIAYAKENGTEKEYAIINTDDTGTAYSPALAYGQYVIIQSKKVITDKKQTSLLIHLPLSSARHLMGKLLFMVKMNMETTLVHPAMEMFTSISTIAHSILMCN